MIVSISTSRRIYSLVLTLFFLVATKLTRHTCLGFIMHQHQPVPLSRKVQKSSSMMIMYQPSNVLERRYVLPISSATTFHRQVHKCTPESDQEKNNTDDHNNIIIDNAIPLPYHRYKYLSIMYFIIASTLLNMPNRIQEFQNSSLFRYKTSLVSGSLGYLIASVASFLIYTSHGDKSKNNITSINNNNNNTNDKDNINDNDNVSQSTYNHNYEFNMLNLGLFLFAIIGSCSVPAECAFYPYFIGSFSLYIFTLLTKCFGIYMYITTMLTTAARTITFQTKFVQIISSTLNSLKSFFLNHPRVGPQNSEVKMYGALFSILLYIVLGNHLLSLFHSYSITVCHHLYIYIFHNVQSTVLNNFD